MAAVALVVFLAFLRAPAQSLQLPDGSIVTFKGADFGKTHSYPPNARFLKALARILPYRLSSKLGVRGGYAIGQDSIFFWYSQEKLSGHLGNLERVVVDDNGVESGVITFGCSQRLTDHSNLEGCGTTVWPRRSATVGLRFYCSDRTNAPVKIGEFWTHNPHRVEKAQWQPETVPADRVVGNLRITLAGLEYGPLPIGSIGLGTSHQQPCGYLRFRLAWIGTPTTAWEIRQCALEDATGNKLDLWEHSFTARGDEILPLAGRFQDRSVSILLPYTLWPGERAWRIRAAFCPRAEAPFSADDLFVFHDVPVPGPHQVVTLNAVTNVPGGTITLASIHGIGSDPSGEAGKFPDSPVLTVSPRLSPDHSWVVVRVVDESGQAVPAGLAQDFSVSVGTNSWRTYSGVPLTIPALSKSLAITVGVLTNRVVTFLAPPPPPG